jgi:ABC-type multidrug transport system fused ATPase/permease subunit
MLHNKHHLYILHCSITGQEPVLFSGTIRSNIANGRPDATDDDIIAACKQANAHDFIKAFPHAYSTECGEGGMQLSGGQKQRIVRTCSYIFILMYTHIYMCVMIIC